MKYISSKNGYVSMHKGRIGGNINLLDGGSILTPDSKPVLQDNAQSTKNHIAGVVFPHPSGMPIPQISMLTKGGDLLNSLSKINFQKNTKANKRKNIIFDP